jgi:beta-galactosidase
MAAAPEHLQRSPAAGMRDLLSSSYFPFGSQYYRAPSPRPEDWEGDLTKMAALGFNTVKFWVQWRWNHPEEHRYYWDDIDRLMDLSERCGLRVMLNTIVDVAPAWIYRTYPDASMRTLDGRRVGPQTQPHRQIGGLGLCLNHEDAVGHMMRFLRATFERYSDHPALEIWNFGSEPELTQSMSHLRRWAEDADRIGDMMCHCDRCGSAFRRWLEARYGNIDQLNRSWNRNYVSFDEAELPRTRNTFNDLLDWRMFFVDVLGANVRRRHEICTEVDAGRHPTMCHHVFIQGFPVTSTANDPWNVARYGDLHGFTQMDDPMMHDILRSCARGKPIMSAEMLMLMGYTLDLPESIDAWDVKRHIFTGIAANLKGFIFWQYRPETLGREAPAWGLSHLDGAETPWMQAFVECGAVLQREKDFLFEAAPPQANLAILYNPENQIFAWAATGNEKSATDSLLGVHRALYERNYRVDFVHPGDIYDGRLDDYDVVVAPMAYLIDTKVAEALKMWVARGGTLVAEAYLGGWNREGGRHETTVPGYGLHEVFQVRQAAAEPAAEDEYLFVTGLTRDRERLGIRAGITDADGFVGARTIDVSEGIGRVELITSCPLPGAPAGSKAYGALVKETYFVEGAEVIATYRDGRAAVTRSTFGSGKTVLIGSYLGLSYFRHGDPSTGALLAALVDQGAGITRPSVSGRGRVRVDTLTKDDDVMVIIRNLEEERSEVAVAIDAMLGPLRDVFGGPGLTPGHGAGRSTFVVELEPREVRVYRG